MKNKISIPLLILVGSALSLVSCKSSKDLKDTNTLPKDFYDRPVSESSKAYDEITLENLKTAIETAISKEKCTNILEWSFSPMGAKPCGGPNEYIAYPKKLESSILEKIKNYTTKQEEYNKKYNITSDCIIPKEPSSLECQNGKAILVYK